MTVFLLEVGCEELPAAVCRSLIRQLEGGAAEPGLVYRILAEARLLAADGAEAPSSAAFLERGLRVLVSPRRVAVEVTGVPDRQTALVQRFRGPKAAIAFAEDGGLTKAGAGFARSRGAEAKQVRRETADGVEFAVVEVESERLPALDVLPGLIPRLITALQVPRGMRWGSIPAGADEYLRFSRPIRWLAAKFGSHTVEGTFYGLRVGEVSQGHRVLGAPLIIDRADHYERHLLDQKVVVSQHERRRRIVAGLDEQAGLAGGRWSDPGDVLDEAVYLAEWPSVARGAFAESHLRLPEPVLITAMQSHQRYFPVRDADGRLLAAFLYVSNGDPRAEPLVTHGNERVLDGRLDDAEFAYDRDVSEGLAAMAERLGDVVFHAKLGSLADKSRRLQGLVAGLAAGAGTPGDAPGGNGAGATPADVVRRAAQLAKADLVSQVVIEFPALQGEMGGRYAALGGEGEAVAAAVGEHYRPLSAVAPLPATLSGALLAVADKADNIVGAWVAGEKPSGSRDPYGLRRAAMGIVRIALEYGFRFSLAGVAASALDQFEAQGVPGCEGERRDAIVTETSAFMRERLQALLLEEGLSFPSVEAALASGAPDVPGLAARARAFAALAGRDFFEDAVVVYNRCASLAGKDAEAGGRKVDPALFRDEAERELAAAYAAQRGRVLAEASHLEIESAIKAAAGLRPAVDRYFDAVLVMDPDESVRANRLAQLAAVAALVRTIGEFSRLPLPQA